jgi:alginate O-acetyltransferase complex protein AlgI
MLTGFWHGAAWNFILWGLMFAVLLLAEKWLPVKSLPRVLQHIYVLLLIVISFVIFNANDMAQAGSDLACMFGFGNLPAVTDATLYYLQSFGLLFVIAFVGATPLVKKWGLRLGDTKVGAVLEPILLLLLLLICTAYLVDGAFSPFLYFRF